MRRVPIARTIADPSDGSPASGLEPIPGARMMGWLPRGEVDGLPVYTWPNRTRRNADALAKAKPIKTERRSPFEVAMETRSSGDYQFIRDMKFIVYCLPAIGGCGSRSRIRVDRLLQSGE
ncbi:MAG: hypothetical protein ACR2I5_05820 [Candidatus Limnocylindria bacterium]